MCRAAGVVPNHHVERLTVAAVPFDASVVERGGNGGDQVDPTVGVSLTNAPGTSITTAAKSSGIRSGF